MYQQLGRRAQAFAAFHGFAQTVYRAQGFAACRHYDGGIHTQPERGNISGIKREIEEHIVKHGDQLIVHMLDAGRACAFMQGFVKNGRELKMLVQPVFSTGMREVEMQPDELLIRSIAGLQPGGGFGGIERAAAGPGAEDITADQAGQVGAVGSGYAHDIKV